MMKKAIVVTFLGFENYGAFLQSYGSLCLLKDKKYGHILFYNPALVRFFDIKNPLKISNLISIIRRCLYYLSAKKSFGSLYAHNSATRGIINKFLKDNPLILFGSDQVINKQCYEASDSINERVCSFIGPNHKIYGLAMSHREPEAIDLSIPERNFIQTMPIATCREDLLVKSLKSKFDIETSFCPDPSFYLREKDIKKLVRQKTEILIQRKSILVTGYSIKSWSDKLVLCQFRKCSFLNYEWRHLMTFKSICLKPPEAIYRDFIRHEYIYTNSFHGICLSLILKKKIIVPSSPDHFGGERNMQLLKFFDFKRYDTFWKLEKVDTHKLDYYRNQLISTLDSMILDASG